MMPCTVMVMPPDRMPSESVLPNPTASAMPNSMTGAKRPLSIFGTDDDVSPLSLAK